MSDRWAVALALCAAAGAVAATAVPVWLGLTVVLCALALRRPALLCLGAAVLSSALAARSWAGLEPPAPARLAGTATLVTDPTDVDGAVRLEARLGSRRVEVWARNAAAGQLRPRLAGERVWLEGRMSPLPEWRRGRLAPRHIATRLIAQRVGQWSPGDPMARLTNAVRRTMMRGASSLGEDHRALFAGLVLGDDRDQEPGTVEDFRAAGLSHLLAVSGQNVAFVLALVGPALRWLGLRGRFLAALALLVAFGVITRWEPSVLRAEAMAAISLLAATLGRPVSTLRVLALAVTGLVLVDPLLVRSVGFVLSCGACAGIALFATPLSRRLPLPLAVTLAAQAGVAPVLVTVFDGVAVASVPANLLAAPAAGPVMMWGLAAGVPAGLVGEPVAELLHLPTRVLVGWVAGVARWAASLPLGQLRAGPLLVAAALVVLALRHRRVRLPAVAVGLAAWVGAGLATPSSQGAPVAHGARLWRAGGATVLVVERPRTGAVLAGLRGADVAGLDVVALRSPSAGAARALAPVLDRHPARVVLTPANAEPGTEVTVGGLTVVVAAARPRLDVHVTPAGPRR